MKKVSVLCSLNDLRFSQAAALSPTVDSKNFKRSCPPYNKKPLFKAHTKHNRSVDAHKESRGYTRMIGYATHILLAPRTYYVSMLLYMMKSRCNCIGKLRVSPPWKHAVLHLFFASKNVLPPNHTRSDIGQQKNIRDM